MGCMEKKTLCPVFTQTTIRSVFYGWHVQLCSPEVRCDAGSEGLHRVLQGSPVSAAFEAVLSHTL